MELLTSLFQKYGLFGLCLMILLEYACFPISSELVLPFTGAVARSEDVSFFLLLPLSVLAGLLGTDVLGHLVNVVHQTHRVAECIGVHILHQEGLGSAIGKQEIDLICMMNIAGLDHIIAHIFVINAEKSADFQQLIEKFHKITYLTPK